MDAKSVRGFFDQMMGLGVEGMMISARLFTYDKAPDQSKFLGQGQDAQAVYQDSIESQKGMAIQSERAVP